MKAERKIEVKGWGGGGGVWGLGFGVGKVNFSDSRLQLCFGLRGSGQQRQGQQPVRVRGQHVAAFCSGPPHLDTPLGSEVLYFTFSSKGPL